MWTLYLLTFAGSEVPVEWEIVEVFATHEMCIEAQDKITIKDAQATLCTQFLRQRPAEEAVET